MIVAATLLFASALLQASDLSECASGWPTVGRFTCDASGARWQEICRCLPPGYADPRWWVEQPDGCFAHRTGDQCSAEIALPACAGNWQVEARRFCGSSGVEAQEVCGCRPPDEPGQRPWEARAGCFTRSTADACSLPGANLSRLWDPGFRIGTWRTDFDDPRTGTARQPLTLLPCAFDLDRDPLTLNGAGPTRWNEVAARQEACDTFSAVYPQANASTSAADWPLDRFWVVSANNETAYGTELPCPDGGMNSGPPGQSKPVTAPGNGVFGVEVVASSSPGQNKAVLSIDTQRFANCTTPVDKGKIPFLSIGAQTARGNGPAPLTYLNDSAAPDVLHFTATIEDLAPAATVSASGDPRVNFGYVFIEAVWGGVRRWLAVYLFAQNPQADPPALLARHWNWNIEQSMWAPGAELVYVGAQTLPLLCPGASIGTALAPARVGASASYAINLSAAYACLSRWYAPTWSTPIPPEPVPITGIHWAVEQAHGGNWTSMSVQDIRLQR